LEGLRKTTRAKALRFVDVPVEIRTISVEYK